MRRALGYLAALCLVAVILAAIFVVIRPGHTSVSRSQASPSVAASPAPSPTTTPTPTPPTAPAPATTYAVKAGDSLWSIATALYPGRANACYTVLYRLNAATIEAAARAHGHRTSQHGRWLFVGEALRLASRC